MAFEKVYIKNPFRNRDKNIHMQIEPGTFVYMESFNNETNVGYKFSIEKFSERMLVRKANADRIIWDSISGSWKLKNYFIRQFDGYNEILLKGKDLDTIINLKPSEFTMIRDDIKTLNYSELREYIAKEKLKGSTNIQQFVIEKHNRIAFPFATIVLTLIGVSLSSRKVRGGIGVHLGFGIALTFSYILFMQISNVFATHGNLSPVVAAWIPNVIFGFIAIYLIRIAPK